MEIDTNRVILRNFTSQDLADVFAYCSQEQVGQMAGWKPHKTIEDSAAILKGWIENENQFAIVYKENNNVIGHIAIDEDSEEGRADTKELGCALHPDYQRKGIMSEVIKAVLDNLFQQDINYVWACCFQINIASKKVIEHCGFILQQEGNFYSKSLDQEFKSYEYRISKEEYQEFMNK